jgi:hypothetical protein
VLFAVIAVGCVGAAVAVYLEGARSSYVQHHGARVAAIVGSVANTQHCGRGGCYYTAAISVLMSREIKGRITTVVHYPGFSGLSAGELVTVLVDPRQPSYAELPGATFAGKWTWLFPAVAAVVFGWLTVLQGRELRRVLAHRRESRAQVAATAVADPVDS